MLCVCVNKRRVGGRAFNGRQNRRDVLGTVASRVSGADMSARPILPPHEQPAASKEVLTLVGKQSPHGLSADLSAQSCAREEPVPHGPTAAPLPGGRRRPTTSMSLRDRAYLKSSRGQQPAPAARPPLPKLKAIPPLDLQKAIAPFSGKGGRADAVGAAGGNKSGLIGALKDRSIQLAGLPARPASVLGTVRSDAVQKDALQVDRPYSVAGMASGALNRAVGFANGVDLLPDAESRSISSAGIAHSRVGSALGPLRLNTAELIRQNEILKRENDELRRLALQDAGGPRGGQLLGSRGGRSGRSESLTVLSNRSTLSSTWQSTNRSRKPSTSGSNALLTGRSDLSTANSIKFIQGKENPAEKRIQELEAEILRHRQREEELKASLLSTESLSNAQSDFRVLVDHDLALEQVQRDALPHRPFPANEVDFPTMQIDMQSRPETRHELPAGRSSPSVLSTARSARPPVSHVMSAPRTAGNLTPYPRGASAISNSAVIGAPRGVTADETNGKDKPEFQPQTISRTGAHPVTSPGPHAIVLKDHGNNEWVAQGLKIDPLKSSVEMSQSSRLVYPNQRLHTLAHGGGGSYAYSAAGRGPIMGLHSTHVPDGLMVRSPVRNGPARPADGSASEQEEAQPDRFSVSVKRRPKVLRGDKEANSWHADLASSGMRWVSRTRKFAQECFVLCVWLLCCIACRSCRRGVPYQAQFAFPFA